MTIIPKISVVIPAFNEEQNIGKGKRKKISQEYSFSPGLYDLRAGPGHNYRRAPFRQRPESAQYRGRKYHSSNAHSHAHHSDGLGKHDWQPFRSFLRGRFHRSFANLARQGVRSRHFSLRPCRDGVVVYHT